MLAPGIITILWGVQESVVQSEKTIAAAERNEMTRREKTDE